MSLDWQGEAPLSKEEQALAHFLNDLQRKVQETVDESDALTRIRDEWKAALGRKAEWGLKQPAPIWKETCPACNGMGRLTEMDEDTRYQLNSACLWCEGRGLVVMQTGTRGR